MRHETRAALLSALDVDRWRSASEVADRSFQNTITARENLNALVARGEVERKLGSEHAARCYLFRLRAEGRRAQREVAGGGAVGTGRQVPTNCECGGFFRYIGSTGLRHYWRCGRCNERVASSYP